MDNGRDLEYLENEDEWDFEGAELQPPVENPGAIVAVRFTSDDFQRLARHAAETGRPLTAFIRDAALEKVAQPSVR